MSNLIHQFYNGELIPSEYFRPKIEEYIELMRQVIGQQSDFIARLNAVDTALTSQFMEIADAMLREYPLESAEVFNQGFRLGARMMLEILQEE
ncbi:MAG: hypothetical protein IJ769_11625 [Clostridia bacterium]|nr:hypothetical protein [Clostridia bacterium]